MTQQSATSAKQKIPAAPVRQTMSFIFMARALVNVMQASDCFMDKGRTALTQLEDGLIIKINKITRTAMNEELRDFGVTISKGDPIDLYAEHMKAVMMTVNHMVKQGDCPQAIKAEIIAVATAATDWLKEYKACQLDPQRINPYLKTLEFTAKHHQQSEKIKASKQAQKATTAREHTRAHTRAQTSTQNDSSAAQAALF